MSANQEMAIAKGKSWAGNGGMWEIKVGALDENRHGSRGRRRRSKLGFCLFFFILRRERERERIKGGVIGLEKLLEIVVHFEGF